MLLWALAKRMGPKKELGHKVPAGFLIACEYAVVGRAKKPVCMSHGWAVRSNNCLFGVYALLRVSLCTAMPTDYGAEALLLSTMASHDVFKMQCSRRYRRSMHPAPSVLSECHIALITTSELLACAQCCWCRVLVLALRKFAHSTSYCAV
jgi:hypothetical protein